MSSLYTLIRVLNIDDNVTYCYAGDLRNSPAEKYNVLVEFNDVVWWGKSGQSDVIPDKGRIIPDKSQSVYVTCKF